MTRRTVILACSLLLGGALAGQQRSVAAADRADAAESVRLEARGETVTASLAVIAPGRWGERGLPFDLFLASADSAFWCGPSHPHPYSWLRTSVVCRDTLDFRVEVLEASGKRIDVLDFDHVPPAAYLLDLQDPRGLPDGIITLRFMYDEAVIWDGRLKRMSRD